MVEALLWYSALILIGAGGLLPSAMVFPNLWSGGVLYARPLAMLISGLAIWLATHLTPLPYGTATAFLALGLLWAGSILLAWRHPERLWVIWERRRVILVGEVLFAALFVLLAVARGQVPAALGNEKPMEVMLLTAVHYAGEMPPSDPWFAGESVAYYHLGYLVVDIVSRLAGLLPGEAFNLGLATAGALAGAGAFALAGDLTMLSRPGRRSAPWLAGGIALLSLVFLAPLQGFFEVLWRDGIGTESMWSALGVAGFPGPSVTPGMDPNLTWWWWHPTRTIPDTITEFPAFSLLLGDLHPHVLSLPFGIVALALATATTLAAGESPGVRYLWSHRFTLVTAAGVFAGLYMTNAWDVIPYGAVWLVLALLAGLSWGGVRRATLSAILHLMLPGALAVLFAAPFILRSSTPLEGLGLVVRASDPVRFGLVWVPLVLPLVVATALVRPRTSRPAVLGALALGALAVLVWALAAYAGGHAGALVQRGAGWLVLLTLVGVGSWSTGGAVRAQRDGDTSRAAWLAIVAACCAIVLFTELAYLVEAFHFGSRTNTVFKLWFVVWLLLSLAGGVAVAHASSRLPRARPPALNAVLGLSLALYLVSLFYGPAVFDSRVREFQAPSANALAFHEFVDPQLAAAMRWIEANLSEEAVVLEAVGDSHSYTSVVSANTHVSTLLGWLNHELIWRGRIPEISQRWAIVHEMYLSGATEQNRKVAERYGVTHVYIGHHALERYGDDLIERFADWPTVFVAGRTRIIEVPPASAGTSPGARGATPR